MKTIWKYYLGVETTIELPKGAKFLAVDQQDNDAVVWFLVGSEQLKEPRKFSLYGTGHEITEGQKYLGTFQSPPYVWHLFEDCL